jgi:hypothetical protein
VGFLDLCLLSRSQSFNYNHAGRPIAIEKYWVL